jgi:hypothetical protein
LRSHLTIDEGRVTAGVARPRIGRPRLFEQEEIENGSCDRFGTLDSVYGYALH